MTGPSPFVERPGVVRSMGSDRRGVAAVEFAIVGLLLLTMIFGIINLGDLAWTYDTLHAGVVASARYASVTTSAGLGSATAPIGADSCTGQQSIQDQFAARVSPPVAAGTVPSVKIVWGGSLAVCDAIADTSLASLPGGWVWVTVSYVWHPIAMADIFSGVTISSGDIEPVMNAPQS